MAKQSLYSTTDSSACKNGKLAFDKIKVLRI